MEYLTHILRKLVMLLAGVAGVGLLTMMGVTCIDIVLRVFRHPLPGAYDIVKMAAAVTLSCALPYTTAVKGHVAVEFFFLRLNRPGRIVADCLIRLVTISLFSVLTWQTILYGTELRKNGVVSTTIQWPVFWVPYLMALACAVVVLVTLYHLFHPGKALLPK
jgi:TRAP-type C4-dicarboxylate transport system permease small subunit